MAGKKGTGQRGLKLSLPYPSGKTNNEFYAFWTPRAFDGLRKTEKRDGLWVKNGVKRQATNIRPAYAIDFHANGR